MKTLHPITLAKPRTVVLVSGVKGGVGKSHQALTLQYIYTELYPSPGDVRIIDLDSDNDDVLRASGLPEEYATSFDISLEGTWTSVYNIIVTVPYKVLIVNLPAQIGKVMNEFGQHVMRSLQNEMNVDIQPVTVWALGPSRDSTNALYRYTTLETGEPIFVSRAIFQVDDPRTDFSVWDRKKDKIDLRGGGVFDHLKSPYLLRAALFDGVETGEGETYRVDRWSIKKFITENMKTAAGIYAAESALNYIKAMAREIGVKPKHRDL